MKTDRFIITFVPLTEIDERGRSVGETLSGQKEKWEHHAQAQADFTTRYQRNGLWRIVGLGAVIIVSLQGDGKVQKVETPPFICYQDG